MSEAQVAAALAQAQAALARSDARAALQCVQRALTLSPEHPQALAVLANCGALLSEPELALRGLVPLLRRDPGNAALRRATADALNLRGARQRKDGDHQAALTAFSEATVLAPAHRLAWINTALALHDLGRDAEARTALARHLELVPGDDEARVLDARLARASDPAQAARSLEALRDPAVLGEALAVVGELDRDGEDDAVRSAAAALFELSMHGRKAPGLRAALARHLALPAVVRSLADMHAARARFEAGLDALEAGWDDWVAHAEPALSQLAWCNFKLAYQGLDDRVLQRRYAALVERAAARLFPQWTAPPPTPRRAKPRVALLSSGFRYCTVGAYFGGWIGWLRVGGFDVRVYQLGSEDATTARLGERAGHLHVHTGRLDALVEAIRDDAPDLLLYPELGMDPRLTALAALRLAPRQVVAWGHPVTTGFANIDAYLSCFPMEPEGAEADYSEQLLMLPGLGVDYDAPAPPDAPARAALGLPDDSPLLLVPQSLFKLHPAFDALLARVATALPELRVVLIDQGPRRWRDRVQARLDTAFAASGADALAQLCWLPSLPRERFLALNAVCDLMMDVPQWSGGNTALDALLSGLPITTVPGDFMRARQSAAMLRMLGVDGDLVCADADALVERTVALLGDADGRARLRERILGNRDALLDPRPAREAFLAHMRELCRRP